MPSTITVNIATRRVVQSDPVWARDVACVLNLTNYGSVTASNMRAALYRVGVTDPVATAPVAPATFVVTDGVASAVLSTETVELIAVFTAHTGLRSYEQLDFKLLVYDAADSLGQYLFMGDITIQNNPALLPGTPPHVVPITPGTTIFGNIEVIGGIAGMRSTTDGEWYPLTLAGSGQTTHLVTGETGTP